MTSYRMENLCTQFQGSRSVGTDFFFLRPCGPNRAMASSFLRFLDHTQRRITVGRTPLDERSARRREVYLTTHNTHNRNPCHRRDATPQISRRAAADLRLRPRDQWDRQRSYYPRLIIFVLVFPTSKCFPRCFSIKERDSLSRLVFTNTPILRDTLHVCYHFWMTTSVLS